MERHEHFEELCAAASVGQASGAELAELEDHLRSCSDCEQIYADFLQLGAVRVLGEATRPVELSGSEAIGYIDSVQFRERFLRNAEARGILPSANIDLSIPEPVFGARKPDNRRNVFVPLGIGIAASILLAVGGIEFHRASLEKVHPASANSRTPAISPAVSSREASKNTTSQPTPTPERDAIVARLEGENRRLTAEIASLQSTLDKESAALDASKLDEVAAKNEQASLLTASKQRDAKIDDLQQQLDQAQSQAASARAELESNQTTSRASVAADQLKIDDLSAQLAEQSNTLAREREMLAANRDIRELMAARNLHIADVFDTDSRGKTRSAFGRVFFTEGKSLIIYAYDLNDPRVQDAGYRYRVWGKKEGPGQGPKSLGIFYSDDKAQKRWVFKYEDPKVLREIDSVFVTLEPPGKELAEPKGEKFLYAYLRNQPNHP